MAGISLNETGLRFVWVCLQNYWGSCLFLLLFAAGILWSLFCHRKQEARIFLGYAVFLALTAYNPFLVNYIVPKINFENEYYRLFWILPVIPGVAYYGVRLIFTVKRRWGKVFLTFLFAAILVVTGTPIQGVVNHFALAENIYKVPDDLRAVCDVIHENSKKAQPRVIFDGSLNSLVRQYDPSIQLVLHRNAVLYRAGSTVIDGIDENSDWYHRQKTLMDVLYYSMPVDLSTFQHALTGTHTDYLVVPLSWENHEYLRQAGCEPIAQTKEYVVYYYDWQSARRTS